MRHLRRVATAALAASLALTLPPAAGATDVSSAQLQALAGRAAAGDALALSALRGVTAVDGRPAQVGAALEAQTAQQLRSRLVTLSAPTNPAANVEPGQAQATADQLLAAPRFQSQPVPDPLATALNKLGDWLGSLAAGAPGGPGLFWGVLAALVLALTGLGVRRMMRRLEPAARARTRAGAADQPTPDSLRRDAQAAENAGAFGDAVRLRFRAGLLALGDQRAIEYRPSLLTTDVARRLHSAQFDALASTFERIAYGGEPGVESDAAAAREGWTAVLSNDRRR
jgi:hypothetical protein